MTHDVVLALSDENVDLAGTARVLGPAGMLTVEQGIGSETPADWISEAQIQLKELLLLPTNWDSYGAPPVDEASVEAAMQILQAVGHAPVPVPRPYVGPTSHGGVKLEWDANRLCIAIEVGPRRDLSVFIDDYERDEEWEGPLADLPGELGEFFLLMASR